MPAVLAPEMMKCPGFSGDDKGKVEALAAYGKPLPDLPADLLRTVRLDTDIHAIAASSTPGWNGRTIVETPEDALTNFIDTDMPFLCLEGVLVTRKQLSTRGLSGKAEPFCGSGKQDKIENNQK